MFVRPEAWSPWKTPTLRESTTTGAVIPRYEFVHQLQPSSGAIPTHADNRRTAIAAGIAQSKSDFGKLWTLQQANVPPLTVARQMGLEQSGATRLFLKDPGLAEGWQYLVYYQSPLDDTYKVSEQKTMEGSVAEYIGATTQMSSLLQTTHRPRYGTQLLGEEAIRTGGIEAARGTSKARYGLTDQQTNAKVDASLRRYRHAKDTFERGRFSTTDLITDLEQKLSEGLAVAASPALDLLSMAQAGVEVDWVFRISAVLHIAWREHNLKEEIKKHFDAVTIAKAVAEAVAVGALLATLSKLGPIGRLLSTAISEAMRRTGASSLGTLLMLLSWIDTTRRVDSLGWARAQAFFSVDVVDALMQFVMDKIVEGVAGKVRQWGNPARWAPKTTREVSDALKRWLTSDQLKHAAADVTAERQRVEARPKSPENDQLLAELKALEADLTGKPADDVTIKQPTIESRMKEAADIAKAEGVDAPAQKVRVDVARASMEADLKAEVRRGMGPQEPGHPVPDIEFADLSDPTTRTTRAAKVELKDGKVVKIIIDKNATLQAAFEEGIHAAQSRDPRMAKLFKQLDPGKPWDKMTSPERVAAVKAKLEIEIDAKKRLLDELELSGSPDAPDEMIRALEDIDNLRHIQLEVAALKPADLAKADILQKPPTLYAKKTKPAYIVKQAWSAGTLGDFRRQFEAGNPHAAITLKDMERLYRKTKSTNNPNRLVRAEMYDAPAKVGPTVPFPIRTRGRATGELLLTVTQKAEVETLLVARDAARRQRNTALEPPPDYDKANTYNQKVVDASQRLGEIAGQAWGKQSAWEHGQRPTKVYGGEGSRSGDFDRIDKWVDDNGVTQYLVVEAKGAEGKPVGKWVNKRYVEQGSREYFEAIVAEMSKPTASAEARAAATDLRSILDTGVDSNGKPAAIRYEKVVIPVDYVDAPRTTLGEKAVVEVVEVSIFDI